jgi:hypothetical protein
MSKEKNATKFAIQRERTERNKRRRIMRAIDAGLKVQLESVNYGTRDFSPRVERAILNTYFFDHRSAWGKPSFIMHNGVVLDVVPALGSAELIRVRKTDPALHDYYIDYIKGQETA